MYYLILHTPPDTYNSEYTAHLIEHIKLAYSEPIGFFAMQKYDGTSYSYYSTYTIDTPDTDIVWKFIEHLISPIKSEKIIQERKRIREELEEREYSKKVVETMGKIFYSQEYRYARSTRASLMDLQSYHAQYYTKDSIRVFSKKDIITKNLSSRDISNIEISEFRILNITNIALITELNTLNLFLFFLFEKLFDNYLDYLDTLSGKYWSRYTIEWEHPGKVWLSYQKSDTIDLVNIPEDFLKSFVQQTIQDIQNNTKDEIPEYDLLSLFHFWYSLSIEAKIEIIQNMNSYYSIMKWYMDQH